MGGGGLGIAEQFAQELDPSLLTQSAAAAGATPSGVAPASKEVKS